METKNKDKLAAFLTDQVDNVAGRLSAAYSYGQTESEREAALELLETLHTAINKAVGKSLYAVFKRTTKKGKKVGVLVRRDLLKVRDSGYVVTELDGYDRLLDSSQGQDILAVEVPTNGRGQIEVHGRLYSCEPESDSPAGVYIISSID